MRKEINHPDEFGNSSRISGISASPQHGHGEETQRIYPAKALRRKVQMKENEIGDKKKGHFSIDY